MPSAIDNAGIFIITTLFDLYIFTLLLRIILQWVGADFYNPLSQFVVKMTNPILKPLQPYIPARKNINVGAMIISILLEMIKISLLVLLQVKIFPNIFGLMIWSVGDLLNQLLNMFFYATLAIVLISWISPATYSPLIEILHRITEPLLRPARRFIPAMGGIDLSPIVVLMALKVIEILFTQPLIKLGANIISTTASKTLL